MLHSITNKDDTLWKKLTTLQSVSILGLDTLVNAIKCHVALSVIKRFMLVLSTRLCLMCIQVKSAGARKFEL